MIDLNSAKRVVQKNDPVISFSKSERFKQAKEDNLMQASVMSTDSQSTNASVSSLDHIKKKTTTVLFPKAARFSDQSKTVVTEFNLNPNFEVTKKKFPGVVIKEPVQKDLKVKIAQKLQTNGFKYAKAAPVNGQEAGNENAAAPAEEELALSMSDILSDSTVDSIGPGAYNPNYAAVEIQKAVGFSRSGRFKDTKPLGHAQELSPNYNAVWKAAPGVKIAQTVPVTEQLKKKRKEQEEQLELRNRFNRLTALDRDKSLRRNVPKVVMRPEFAGLDPKQRFARMLMIV